jgi:hypothetical protein
LVTKLLLKPIFKLTNMDIKFLRGTRKKMRKDTIRMECLQQL